MEKLCIYIISDSIGETAEKLSAAGLCQFEGIEFEVKKFTYIRNAQLLMDILLQAESENPVIVYTLLDLSLIAILKEFCTAKKIYHIDMINNAVCSISMATRLKPLRKPGHFRKKMMEGIAQRINALDFAIKYDDGKDPRGIHQADVVLVGISRTCKTPLGIILGNMGIKSASVPLAPELPVPHELFSIKPGRIVGLSHSPENLAAVRDERLRYMGLPSGNYSSIERIRLELEHARKVMACLGCPVIDVTDRSLEELAHIIVSLVGR